jgi:hypothetical protein
MFWIDYYVSQLTNYSIKIFFNCEYSSVNKLTWLFKVTVSDLVSAVCLCSYKQLQNVAASVKHERAAHGWMKFEGIFFGKLIGFWMY